MLPEKIELLIDLPLEKFGPLIRRDFIQFRLVAAPGGFEITESTNGRILENRHDDLEAVAPPPTRGNAR